MPPRLPLAFPLRALRQPPFLFAASRISAISFGIDHLLCTANTAACWHRNQRVDFVYRAWTGAE